MSTIVRPIRAFVGETVRITWTRRTYNGLETIDETLEEDHTAPPPDTWKARTPPPKDDA